MAAIVIALVALAVPQLARGAALNESPNSIGNLFSEDGSGSGVVVTDPSVPEAFGLPIRSSPIVAVPIHRGAASGPPDVLAPSSDLARGVRVFRDDAGGALVLWLTPVNPRGGTRGVFALRGAWRSSDGRTTALGDLSDDVDSYDQTTYWAAMNRRGDVVVSWRHASDHLSVVTTRPAGGEFGDPVPVTDGDGFRSIVYGLGVSDSGRVYVDVGRTDMGPGVTHVLGVGSVNRGIDSWHTPDELRGSSRLILRVVGERAKVAWVPDPPGSLIDVADISEDGSLGPVQWALDSPYRPGVPVYLESFAINGAGGAVVTWMANPSIDSAMRIAVANPGRRFGRPATLFSGFLPVTLRSALNESGDAVVVWGNPRVGVAVATWPAGRGAPAPARWVDVNAGGVPTVGIEESGAGTVVWERTGGLRVDLLGMRFTSRQLEPVRRIATFSTAPTPVRRGHGCWPAHSRTVLASRSVRVFRRTGGYYGCAFRRGVALRLGDPGATSYPPPAIGLTGSVVGYAYEGDLETGPDAGGETTYVEMVDLQTGAAPGGLPAGSSGPGGAYAGLRGHDANPQVGSLVVGTDGVLAWIECVTDDVHHEGDPRPGCLRSGHLDRVLVYAGADVVQLDHGDHIEPRSLALRRRRLSWIDGGRTRTALLPRRLRAGP